MICENYPIYKGCSFLAVNFYEEISTTFEDCLTEALICENAFLESENSSDLGKVNEIYRSPWTKIQYDEEFISHQISKIEESIPEKSENISVILDLPVWISETDDSFNELKNNPEEDIFDEKDLDLFQENTLDGKYQLLDVPYIPFTLSNSGIQYPSIIDLLKKLPLMEVDDSDFSNEIVEAIFDTDFEDTKGKAPQISIEDSFEELTLPEIPDDDNFFEIENIINKDITMTEPIEFENDQEIYSNDQNTITTMTQSKNMSFDIQFDCDIKSELFKNGEENNNAFGFQKTCNPVKISHFENTQQSDIVINNHCVEENDINDHILNDEINTALNGSPQSLHNNENLNAVLKSDSLENYFENLSNPENNITEIMDKIIGSTSCNAEIGNHDYGGYSFKNDFNESNINFQYLDKNHEDIFSQHVDFNVETLTKPEGDLPQSHLVEIKNQGKLHTVNDNERNAYLEKMSHLTLDKKINMNEDYRNFSSLPSCTNSKNLKSCTAVRKDKLLNNQINSTINKNSQDKIIASQNLNSSQSVNLLSNFLNLTKLTNNRNIIPSTKLSPSHFSPNFNTDKTHQNYEYSQSSSDSLSQAQSFPKKCSPLSKLIVEDVHVKFMGKMVNILLIYEANAVPLLQSLMKSGQFKFPPKYTIADISSCKTCFLLNQEVKQCRDENIDLFKEDSYEIFIKKFDDEMDNFAKNDFVHPKIRELSTFLKEKFNICKNIGQKFKVLIIIKKHLNIVYKSLESALKQLECNFKIFLIPESVFLHENTLMFKSSEDTVYIISPFSLSKNIPWKDLILVIEYEQDCNSFWKQICSEKTIMHAFVQVVELPLKSLEEIQKITIQDKITMNPVKENIRSLIVSTSVMSQYQLLYLLESKLNISVCIRQYKEMMPHLHFADIAIDAKSALILISNVSFSVDDFQEILYDRVSFLFLKYEVCWMIVQENIITLKHVNWKENFWKFYLSTENLCKNSQYNKIKILHTHSIEDTSDFIKSIVSRSMDKHHVSVSSQITKEEIFLMSFPSLNPYVVNHMLSLCCLHELMNLTLNELLLKWSFIPERFLKCFYLTLHKVSTSSPDASDESPDSTPHSDHEKNSLEFELKPNFQENLSFSLDFDDPEDIPENETFTNIETGTNNLEDDIPSLLWTHKESPCTPEKSLQELDLDYMSLKLSHKYDAYENILNEEDTSITNETSNNVNHQEDSYSFEILNSKLPKSIWDTEDYYTAKNNDFINLTKLNNRLDFLNSSSNRVDIGQEALPNFNSQKENNFKQFLCTPRKRKYSMVQDSVKNNDTIISSPILKKSCRIQKGMVSKTVSKNDLIYKPNNQDISPYDPDQVKVIPFARRDIYREDLNKNSKQQNDADIFLGHSLSQWSDPSSPLRSLPMTPATSRRLSYEKMPGVKGQTRLVFR
ncbi:uncharacterized protein CDAR_55311 [Caerostris darwini]|uniref:Uncharacterized protein n=1 Tax=Caerostris darwini TaxID=1538125 RepID=A0AAV4R796_9ARAC|nr:uncharacterized protein CDAR_55311 [Caerostris darwini]